MKADNDYYKLCIQLGLWLCQKDSCRKSCRGIRRQNTAWSLNSFLPFLLGGQVLVCHSKQLQKPCQREFLLCWSTQSCITHLWLVRVISTGRVMQSQFEDMWACGSFKTGHSFKQFNHLLVTSILDNFVFQALSKAQIPKIFQRLVDGNWNQNWQSFRISYLVLLGSQSEFSCILFKKNKTTGEGRSVTQFGKSWR